MQRQRHRQQHQHQPGHAGGWRNWPRDRNWYGADERSPRGFYEHGDDHYLDAGDQHNQ